MWLLIMSSDQPWLCGTVMSKACIVPVDTVI